MKIQLAVLLLIFVTSCQPEIEPTGYESEPISQATFLKKPNINDGCAKVKNQKVRVTMWAGNYFSVTKGINIYLNNNDKEIVYSGTLFSSSRKVEFDVQLSNKGYNNLILSYPSSSVTDPVEVILQIEEQTLKIYYDNAYNGNLDLIYDPDDEFECILPDGRSSVMFWTNFDPLCGFFQVELGEHEAKSMTAYYEIIPGCGATGCVTFDNLVAGVYSYQIACGKLEYDSGTVEVSGFPGCKKILLN